MRHPTRPVPLVVYGDFNCPYSALASHRADRLADAGIAEVDWRAVEHDPDAPLPSEPVSGDLAVTLQRELDEVRTLMEPDEDLILATPLVRPNTHAAVTAYGRAAKDDRPVVRQRLFRALWVDRRDIGIGSVVRALVPEVGQGTGDWQLWQAEWRAFERRVVPMLLFPDGYVSRGIGALRRLRDLFDDRGSI